MYNIDVREIHKVIYKTNWKNNLVIPKFYNICNEFQTNFIHVKNKIQVIDSIYSQKKNSFTPLIFI